MRSLYKISSAMLSRSVMTGIGLAFTFGGFGGLSQHNPPTPGHFVDATQKLGIHFRQQASPTSKKYLLETMGSGVALFDYDNDGRLDIFFANGARHRRSHAERHDSQKRRPEILEPPLPPETRWHLRRRDGKGRPRGFGYSTGVAVGDYDNDGYEDLYVAGYGHSTLYHNNGDGTFTDVTAARASRDRDG